MYISVQFKQAQVRKNVTLSLMIQLKNDFSDMNLPPPHPGPPKMAAVRKTHRL